MSVERKRRDSFLVAYEEWTQSARFLTICLLGILGWWLLGAAILCGPLAGIDEPYWGWSGTLRGIEIGLKAGPSVSAIVFGSASLLPSLIAAAIRFRQTTNGLPTSRFAGMRAWLMSSWLVFPVAALFAPIIMLRVSVHETGAETADPIPAWATSTFVDIVGHPAICLVLLVLALALSIAKAAIATAKYRARTGVCEKCSYDLSGIPVDAPCPECGWMQNDSGLPQASMVVVQSQHRERRPFALLFVWMVLAILILSLHFISNYSPFRLQYVLVSIPSMTVACIFVAVALANVARFRHVSAKISLGRLCWCLLWLMIPIGLCIVAQHVAYQIDSTRHPNKPAYWKIWWLVYGLIRWWLIPIAFATTTAWWLVASGLRDERKQPARANNSHHT